MKKLFYLPLLALFLTACGNDTASDGTVPADQLASTADFVASADQDTAAYVPLYIHKIPAESEIDNSITSLGSFANLIVPPMEQLHAQMLTKSYWVVEGYADRDGSRAQKIAATGQWLQCFPNGSFRGGHWGKQTHAGAWYLNYQGRFPRLTLDSNVDRLDSVWEIQGVSGDQASMAWIRVNSEGFGLQRRSLSVKLVELYDRPTKEQFAGVHGGL